MPRQPGTHVDDPAAVGIRLREVRERAGLSQRELAFDGCTPAYVSRIEAGLRIPSLQILRELAKRLGVDSEYLSRGTAGTTELDLLDAELEVRLGDPEHAVELYEALAARRRPGSPDATVAAGLGRAALGAGRPAEAVTQLESALAIGGLAPADEAAAADALARAHALRGEYDVAFGILESHLADAQERDDLVEIVRFSVLLANALADAGDGARASQVIGAVLQHVQDVLDPTARAALLWTRSRVHARECRLDLAKRYAQMALDALRLAEQAADEAQLLRLAAQIENDRDNPREALELLDRGLARIPNGGDAARIAVFDVERAHTLLALGDREQAVTLATNAAATLSEASPAEAGRAYALLAGVFRDLGEPDRARELYELAAEKLEPGPERYRTEVYGALADIFEAEGDHAAALGALRRALAMRSAERRAAGDPSKV